MIKDHLKKLARLDARKQRDQKRQRVKQMPEGEKKALKILKREARERGSFLASGGEGGLPSSLVLGVMRRDDYKCKRCGKLGDADENGGISVHHKGGIVESKWLSKKGHANDPNNIVTICNKCHDAIHEEARDEGEDSSQVVAEGDVGDPKRDHGQPRAKV